MSTTAIATEWLAALDAFTTRTGGIRPEGGGSVNAYAICNDIGTRGPADSYARPVATFNRLPLWGDDTDVTFSATVDSLGDVEVTGWRVHGTPADDETVAAREDMTVERLLRAAANVVNAMASEAL